MTRAESAFVGLFVALSMLCAVAFSHAQVSYPQGPSTPSYSSSATGTMYSSTCSVVIANSTPTSTFCPAATDPTSVSRRTYPANTLTPGKAFALDGGGIYTAPTANTITATIVINVGSGSITTTTPAAPTATNQGVVFHADCRVDTTTTIICTGYFLFVLLNTAPIPVDVSGTATFNPAISNLVDVQGYWNGTTTTQSTTVQTAVLTARN